MSVLSEILADKRSEINRARCTASLESLRQRIAGLPAPRDFVGALLAAEPPALIAEIKGASPSKGILRQDLDPAGIARIYDENGVACISVLTDEPHFRGSLEHLRQVRAVTERPLLRKDFIIDEYQILEARASGADAVLLIVAALPTGALHELAEIAHGLGMAVLIEVHDGDELEEALTVPGGIIGINNRDLHTFRTHLRVTLGLMPKIPPDRLVVSESGIFTRADVEALGAAGVRAVLVGEALMRATDVGAKVRELLGRE